MTPTTDSINASRPTNSEKNNCYRVGRTILIFRSTSLFADATHLGPNYIKILYIYILNLNLFIKLKGYSGRVGGS